MPQDALFGDRSPHDGLRITWEEVEFEQGQAWNLVVRIRRRGGMWETVAAERWSGYMVDLVSTLASDVTTAFFFGDERDTSRAVASVARTARRHARAHERVG